MTTTPTTSQQSWYPWLIGLGWIAANIAGGIIGPAMLVYCLQQAAISSELNIPNVDVLFYLAGIGVFSLFQWLALSLHERRWLGWSIATTGAFGLGFLMGYLYNGLSSRSTAYFLPESVILTFVLICAGVGIGQWLLLRRTFRQAGGWIPLTIVGYLIALIPTGIVTYSAAQAPIQIAPFAVFAGASSLFTGLYLVRMVKRSVL